jgi:hypothetical protein
MEQLKRKVMGAAAVILLATGAVAQDDIPQGWVPEAIRLPSDAEVLTDRAIGSSLRMFSFATAEDVDEMLTDWEDELRLAGYSVLQSPDELLDRVIEFSGPGIGNAKIAVAPNRTDDRRIVEIDATLD